MGKHGKNPFSAPETGKEPTQAELMAKAADFDEKQAEIDVKAAAKAAVDHAQPTANPGLRFGRMFGKK